MNEDDIVDAVFGEMAVARGVSLIPFRYREPPQPTCLGCDAEWDDDDSIDGRFPAYCANCS